MKLKRTLPLVVAAALQVMPMMRTALPQIQAIAPSAWAIIFRLTTGAVAMFGYHAISSASSIAISPSTATQGSLYTGTITYSGSHAGSVSAMMINGLCMSSQQNLVDGLKTTYNGGYTASVTGTPTSSGNFSFSITMYSCGCNCGLSDTRSTTLVVNPPPITNVAPSMAALPQSVTAQIGSSNILFSAGATGRPTPSYYWYQGLYNSGNPNQNKIGTGDSVTIPTVAYANAGLYTVVASNLVGTAQANAYLSVASTAGSNILSFEYTNYIPVSNQVVFTSFLTNTSAGSNVYLWQYNDVDILPSAGTYSTTNNIFTLPASSCTASKSGIYTVEMKSTIAGTVVVPNQSYDSYWAFGAIPVINTSPPSTNVYTGTNVTFPVTASVQQNPYGTNLYLGFRWYLNATNLLSSTSSLGSNQTVSLSLPNVGATNSGSYTVVVTNYWGSVTSTPAVLTVSSPNTAPGFSAQPSAASVLAGKNASFSVTATGTAPLSYQWQRNGANLSDGGVLSGSKTNTLTLTGVASNNVGSYSVVVTNIAGTNTSSSVALTVSSPPMLSAVFSGTNNFQLNATSLAGLNYIVQMTTNFTTWTPVYTNVVQSGGQLGFTNTNSLDREYFRILFP